MGRLRKFRFHSGPLNCSLCGIGKHGDFSGSLVCKLSNERTGYLTLQKELLDTQQLKLTHSGYLNSWGLGFGPNSGKPLLDSHRAAAPVEGHTGEESIGLSFSKAVRWVSGPCCIWPGLSSVSGDVDAAASFIRTRAGRVGGEVGVREEEGIERETLTCTHASRTDIVVS